VTGVALQDALAAAADAVEGAAAELNRLDGFAGDGDLGITMAAAAEALREVLSQNSSAPPAQLLAACGAAIARAAPSTSGTLVATGFLRASKAVTEPAEGEVALLERVFAAALEGIKARGKASVGDRTMVDGLDAVCASLRESVPVRAGTKSALVSAARAAAAAAEATAAMEPRTGRASWVPERAKGHPDAGCAMLAIALRAVAGN
jgi:dihydroxyacetone kinase